MKFFTSAKNNDEYRVVIKRKMKLYLLLGALGLVTVIAALLAEIWWKPPISDQMLGFYTGAGSAFFVCSIMLYIKNRRLLSDEEKLKRDRLNHTDERLLEISRKAYQTAGIVLLIVSYIAMFIGGLFYPVLTYIFAYTVVVFCLVYTIACIYYKHKM